MSSAAPQPEQPPRLSDADREQARAAARRRIAELTPEADRVRAALQAGATLESLGFTDAEANLDRIMRERGLK